MEEHPQEVGRISAVLQLRDSTSETREEIIRFLWIATQPKPGERRVKEKPPFVKRRTVRNAEMSASMQELVKFLRGQAECRFDVAASKFDLLRASTITLVFRKN